MSMSADLQSTPEAREWAASEPSAPVIPGPGAARAEDAPALREAIEAACSRIPPLWTLRNFVAVNPFMGLSELPFAEATREVDRVLHGRALMPQAFYREQLHQGRIRERDLDAALGEAPQALSRPELADVEPGKLRASLFDDEASPQAARVETLAEAIDREEGSDWSRLVIQEVSKWCAGRFDAGQAAWKQPWRELAPFPAWREAAQIDRTPELSGLRGFRSYVAGLPDEPVAAIAKVLAQLEIPAPLQRDFLTRQLASIAGWAGHVQLGVREAAFANEEDDSLVHLLAIRLAFDGALDRALGGGWAVLGSQEVARPAARGALGEPGWLDDWEKRCIWQLAYEGAYRKRLLSKLARSEARTQAAARPTLQAVFCIDVRSEVLRRHLEEQSSSIQTVGFAGFFGFPLEYVKVGEERGSARCPVLIAPGHRIAERAPRGSDVVARIQRARARHERFGALRKLSVGAYPLVETVGHFFGLRLLTDSLGWTRPREGGALFERLGEGALAPSIEREPAPSGALGLALSEQIDLAEGALRNMGLARNFAEVVLLCGHGSVSTNNPYASGLDCGACGGHRGDVNARVAADVLNAEKVRAGLAERGIHVPADTVFVAGMHDTTRDDVRLFDAGGLDPALREQVEDWLGAACARTREERARQLGESTARGLGSRLRRRAGDWSEVRPEWGLAGNAAFVAARREHTRGLDLSGRVFLHDYDPESDAEGRVLELILTAPMVVASWINLQYYASTTDNEVFGSGHKALHNVVGRHGVMLGNRSDLQVGLPWQSVHDGKRYVHEPMRLTAIIEAPPSRIDAVLAAHPELRQTLENGWIQLLAWDAVAGSFQRFRGGDAGWEPADVASGQL